MSLDPLDLSALTLRERLTIDLAAAEHDLRTHMSAPTRAGDHVIAANAAKVTALAALCNAAAVRLQLELHRDDQRDIRTRPVIGP